MAIKAHDTITLVKITDGVSVTSMDVQYYLSNSATALSGGSWSTTAPTWVDGKYIWSKTITKLSNNTIKETNPVCITGGKGSSGASGVGVSSIIEEYYLSTSKTTQTGGSWVTTPPTWSMGMYIWTRSKITYTNNTIGYTTPIVDSSWEAINDIQVGGRNYIIGSKDLVLDKINDEHGFFNFGSSYSNIPNGTQVTFSFDLEMVLATPNDDNGGYVIAFGNLYKIGPKSITMVDGLLHSPIMISIPGETGTTFSGRVNGTGYIIDAEKDKITNDYNLIEFITGDGTTGNAFRITNPKLELGNKATDWSPAPEDVQSDIDDAQNKADNAESTSKKVEASLQVLSDSISSLVVDKNGQSQMVQDSSGWHFNIGDIQDRLNQATQDIDTTKSDLGATSQLVDKIDSLTSDISKKTAYMTLTADDNGQPVLELGNTNSNFKMKLSNTKMGFWDGSTEVAYISNKQLVIERAIMTDELKIGNDISRFVWKKRTNGNMGLRWESTSM